jgi:DNA-directed RNA polymerase specialized sigma24 family protein
MRTPSAVAFFAGLDRGPDDAEPKKREKRRRAVEGDEPRRRRPAQRKSPNLAPTPEIAARRARTVLQLLAQPLPAQDEIVEQNDTAELLHAELRKLDIPKEIAAALFAVHGEGHSLRSIACELGLARETLRDRMRRAARQLAESRRLPEITK